MGWIGCRCWAVLGKLLLLRHHSKENDWLQLDPVTVIRTLTPTHTDTPAELHSEKHEFKFQDLSQFIIFFTFASSPSPLSSHPPLFCFFFLPFLLLFPRSAPTEDHVSEVFHCRSSSSSLPLSPSFLLLFSAPLMAAQCCRLAEDKLMAAGQKREVEGRENRKRALFWLSTCFESKVCTFCSSVSCESLQLCTRITVLMNTHWYLISVVLTWQKGLDESVCDCLRLNILIVTQQIFFGPDRFNSWSHFKGRE